MSSLGFPKQPKRLIKLIDTAAGRKKVRRKDLLLKTGAPQYANVVIRTDAWLGGRRRR